MYNLTFLDKAFLIFAVSQFNDLDSFYQREILKKIRSDDVEKCRSGANAVLNKIMHCWYKFPKYYGDCVSAEGYTNGLDGQLTVEFNPEYVKHLFLADRLRSMYVIWKAFDKAGDYNDSEKFFVDFDKVEKTAFDGVGIRGRKFMDV